MIWVNRGLWACCVVTLVVACVAALAGEFDSFVVCMGAAAGCAFAALLPPNKVR